MHEVVRQKWQGCDLVMWWSHVIGSISASKPLMTPHTAEKHFTLPGMPVYLKKSNFWLFFFMKTWYLAFRPTNNFCWSKVIFVYCFLL